MHTDANIHACATLSIIYYYKTYSYNNNADFSMASSTLNTALLASVGKTNWNHLKTTFPTLKLYMLSLRAK